MLFPDGAHFDNIHNALYQELVKDVFLPETRDKFRAAIRDLIDRGAEAVILGCTEFGLLVKPEDCAVPLIDPCPRNGGGRARPGLKYAIRTQKCRRRLPAAFALFIWNVTACFLRSQGR